MTPPTEARTPADRHWLDIATHGLTPEAAARVQTEYLTHQHDALDAGEPDAGLQTTWGDPHAVNRALRRAHLTRREAALLPSGYAPGWPGLRAALIEDSAFLCGVLCVGLADLIRGEAVQPLLLGVILGLLTAVLLRWRLLSRPVPHVAARAALFWTLKPITLVALLMLAGLLHTLVTEGFGPVLAFVQDPAWGPALMTLYFGYHALNLLRAVAAARKLMT